MRIKDTTSATLGPARGKSLRSFGSAFVTAILNAASHKNRSSVAMKRTRASSDAGPWAFGRDVIDGLKAARRAESCQGVRCCTSGAAASSSQAVRASAASCGLSSSSARVACDGNAGAPVLGRSGSCRRCSSLRPSSASRRRRNTYAPR